MRILGIDPGYATIGFGLIEGERAQFHMVTYGAITTPAGLPLSKRLYQIDRDMEELIGQLKPDVISIEELFFNTNITTGIAVAHGRGVLLCAAERCGVPLFEYTPGQVKMAVTGYGKAEKRQVMDMTKRLLKLAKTPRPDDAADALALALCHARSSTSRLPQIKPEKETVYGEYHMFYYLDGTVAEILPGLAVIDCGGVGYACMTTNNTLSQLKKGEKKKLYTYLNVGESVFDLYGFASQNELNSFKLLLSVSGVGPKAALAILSANTPEGLAMAVVTEDAKSLTAAQGIGRKIAQRIILELKDKMAKETAAGLDFSGGKGAAAPAVFTSKATEAAAALSVLGYSTQEVQMALKGVDVETLPLEEIIRQSLKKMVK